MHNHHLNAELAAVLRDFLIDFSSASRSDQSHTTTTKGRKEGFKSAINSCIGRFNIVVCLWDIGVCLL